MLNQKLVVGEGISRTIERVGDLGTGRLGEGLVISRSMLPIESEDSNDNEYTGAKSVRVAAILTLTRSQRSLGAKIDRWLSLILRDLDRIDVEIVTTLVPSTDD